MSKFNIAIITGTRAEFGIWRPVLRALHSSKTLHPQLIVTGMHLLPAFGNTIRDIQKEKFPIAARVPMYKPSEPAPASLARGIQGLARAFTKLQPNLVFLLGDRLEMLAAANAALALRIPIAHLHGGESAQGIWDEQIRHAITKMAHLHFCATESAARRIRKMGENPATIHQVGAPALDAAIEQVRQSRRIIAKLRYVCGTNPLLVLHPSSDDDQLEFKRTSMLIKLIKETTYVPIIHAIGPNNDPGHKGILRAYHDNADNIHLEMSLPQDKFWLKLITSGLLIGNSSAGIIEAASFGIPVINIGNRQAGRERNQNVLDVDWNRRQITQALQKSLHNPAFRNRAARRKNLYGDGKSAPRIRTTLEKIAHQGIPLEKKFFD